MAPSVPAFSVIIPTFGRPVFLEEAIASVMHQTVDSFEIIVVDDASPEPVQVPDSSRLHLVRAAVNGGPAQARNLGVQAATGDAVTFLDDDDRWDARRLEMAVEGLQRAPVATCWQSADGRRLEGHVHDEILDGMTPNLGATAIEHATWIPFDGSYLSCEDLVWWLDVTAKHAVATTPRQGLYVRQHSGSREGYGASQRIVDSRRLLADRAGYFAAHPRAAAFRYRRIGLMHRSLGENQQARQAHRRALRLDPNLRDVLHLGRNLRP